MTNAEFVIYKYVASHNNCRRSTLVESLSYSDWTAARKLRGTLDSMVIRGIIQKIGTGKRMVRYTIPTAAALDQPDGFAGDN